MLRILIYSLLLIAGMIASIALDLSPIHLYISTATMICLAYIMIEVGLEFTLDKTRLRSYGKDYLVAATAALFPWIFCTLYFLYFFNIDYREALLIGRFAAPTSAGVLFTMLAAAGLGTTWLFNKARILAIFDDLDTVLIMVPLQIMIVGLRWELILVIPAMLVLLWLAYRYLHSWTWPTNCYALLAYSVALVVLTEVILHATNIEIEVILPAFVLGTLLFNPHDPTSDKKHLHEHAYIEPEGKLAWCIDITIKCLFMFLVGASLPGITDLGNDWKTIAIHVLAVTVIANLGKMFPLFVYKKEATLRTRTALCIALWPRGEVGAGVLLVTLEYGIKNAAIGIAELSLSLNLLLTGIFVWFVIRLLKNGRSCYRSTDPESRA